MESKNLILKKLASSRRSYQTSTPPRAVAQEVFADIPTETASELTERFRVKLSALKGEVITVDSHAEAAQAIAGLIRNAGAKRCGRQTAPLLNTVFANDALSAMLADRQQIDSMVEFDRQEVTHRDIETLDCAFTAADALIARTGSVVLKSTTAGGRRLSVLPPLHCVLATSSQLRSTLSDWLETSHSDRSWSYGTIITGPSRTADIERILVLGAHGPKRLVVLIIN